MLLPLIFAGAARAQDSVRANSEVTPGRPAEETRLSTALFREGLKKRGLHELLELHLKEFPPESPIDVMLMTREVKLATFDDGTKPVEERRRAIVQANEILVQLVEQNPDDVRRFDWLFTLGHSILYKQAETYATNILYSGGNDDDRQRLAPISAQAIDVVRSLIRRIADEYVRIDQLSTSQFGRIEGTGYLDKLDEIAPNADYLLLWTLFYDCLHREPDDPALARQLNEILTTFTDKPTILKTPHEQSRVQIPATLLAGMSFRRLNDHHKAREFLDHTRILASRLTDPTERRGVAWAVTLAEIEGIRNDRDARRWKAAAAGIERLRKLSGVAEQDQVDAFGVAMVAAILERSLNRAHADAAEKAGLSVDAATYRSDAWQALAQLVVEYAGRRDELYAALNRTIPRDTPIEQLDPVDLAARLASLLSQESVDDTETASLLDRAVATGEKFLAGLDDTTRAFAPEILRQLGVTHYRRGEVVRAAKCFLEIARAHGESPDALEAATLAVQLAATAYTSEDNPQDVGDPAGDVGEFYADALRTLLHNHPNSEEATYWRFYYAQLLSHRGEYAQAAAEYAQVDPGHEHYLSGAHLRLLSLARVVKEQAPARTRDAGFTENVDAVLAAYRDLMRIAERAREVDGIQKQAVQRLLADGLLAVADVDILPLINRPAIALRRLTNFETRYPDTPDLQGKLWRIRLLAHEAMGQLDEATDAISAYVTADPEGAGQTLQSLYDATLSEWERLLSAGDTGAAARKAKTALVLAEQLERWSRQYPHSLSIEHTRGLAIQLAEANLLVGRFDVAEAMFAPLVDADGLDAPPPSLLELRAVFGLADAKMKQGKLQEALPTFNRLATTLSTELEVRWQALLLDLRCRTQLQHPPDGIIKVIEQQKFLHPEMGGRRFAEEFDQLLRENRRRRDSAP